jgi:hypothetical protein
MKQQKNSGIPVGDGVVVPEELVVALVDKVDVVDGEVDVLTDCVVVGEEVGDAPDVVLTLAVMVGVHDDVVEAVIDGDMEAVVDGEVEAVVDGDVEAVVEGDVDIVTLVVTL